MRRAAVRWLGYLVCGLLAGCLATGAERAATAFVEHFDGATLDSGRWVTTRQHDFETAAVDLVPQAEGEGHRLRLRAATIGTDDKTVKYLGIRSKDPVVELSEPTTVEFTLDWNHQANGCYLTAGLWLCPTATEENPEDQPDWLKVEYVGVPPGKNGRCLVAARTAGRLRELFTEGWPKEQRTGREIGLQRLKLVLDGSRLEVHENGQLLYQTDSAGPSFTPAYLYLQLSTHSNYRARELFFDDVVVTPGG